MEEQCTDWHGGLGFRNVRLVKSEENSLGIGSYGAVYRAHCDQLVCAAKILHPILFQTRDPGAHRIVERFQREIEFLSGLRHPNIIQYLGSCPDPETRLPVLFMELMDESLTSFLERPENPPPLPIHVQVDIAHDVAQALSHLHHHQVLHRDLSSNNVLLIGSRRAKVTDFGMSKLLGSDPRLTPTYCPGTNVYMSPEALADPPTYTSKLDIFSCGVLIVQLITRKFPNPGPRTYSVQINDPRYQSKQALIVAPELERRKEHLDLISPTHPLLVIALDCLKDKEGQRLTAEQLSSRLISLKESGDYWNSLQRETGGGTSPARDQELEQQLRERELRVEYLTREMEQLQLQKLQQLQQEEKVRNKDELLQRKERENQQLQARERESEQVVAALQQSVDQKDRLLQEKEKGIQELQQSVEQKDRLLQVKEKGIQELQQSGEQKDRLLQKKEKEIQELQQSGEQKDRLLQEKEKEIQELRQGVREEENEAGGVASGPLELQWRNELHQTVSEFFENCGHSVVLDTECNSTSSSDDD